MVGASVRIRIFKIMGLPGLGKRNPENFKIRQILILTKLPCADYSCPNINRPTSKTKPGNTSSPYSVAGLSSVSTP